MVVGMAHHRQGSEGQEGLMGGPCGGGCQGTGYVCTLRAPELWKVLGEKPIMGFAGLQNCLEGAQAG